MDPFTIAALANAGFQILGGIGKQADAKINGEIQGMANETNTQIAKSEIMGKYTNILEEQSKRAGTQKALLGGMDKAGTMYQGAITEHEKALFKTISNQKKDLQNIEMKGRMGAINNRMNTTNSINRANLQITEGMTNAFIANKYMK